MGLVRPLAESLYAPCASGHRSFTSTSETHGKAGPTSSRLRRQVAASTKAPAAGRRFRGACSAAAGERSGISATANVMGTQAVSMGSAVDPTDPHLEP